MDESLHDISSKVDSSSLKSNAIFEGNRKRPLNRNLISACVGAWLGSLALGATFGFCSPCILELEMYSEPCRLTEKEADWFGSLVYLGAIAASAVTGWFIDKYGRRTIMLFSIIPCIGGFLIITYSKTPAMLLTGRALTGSFVGIMSMLSPIYIAEVSPPEIRGKFNAISQIFFSFGILYAFTAGYFLFWTWLAIACILWPLLLGFWTLFMPETPVWLFKNGHISEALRTLHFLQTDDYNERIARTDLQESTSLKVEDFHHVFAQSSVYKPLVMALLLMTFLQFCGYNAILSYAASIFQHANSSIDPQLCAIIISAMQMVSTSLAVVFVERFGRKVLLAISGMGMCVSLAVFSVYYYLKAFQHPHFQDSYGWIPLASLVFYMVMFSIGYGPIPWLLVGELFPPNVRGLCGGIIATFNYALSFLLTEEFFSIISALGADGTYLLFAITCLVGSVFFIVCLPESKGLTPKEIESKFIARNFHPPCASYKKSIFGIDTMN